MNFFFSKLLFFLIKKLVIEFKISKRKFLENSVGESTKKDVMRRSAMERAKRLVFVSLKPSLSLSSSSCSSPSLSSSISRSAAMSSASGAGVSVDTINPKVRAFLDLIDQVEILTSGFCLVGAFAGGFSSFFFNLRVLRI